MRSDTHIFDDLDKIRHIPATIVQGRYDVVCPAETAWELHRVGCKLMTWLHNKTFVACSRKSDIKLLLNSM